MAAVIPRLHRVLQPWLSRLRPLVSPVVEAPSRRRLAAAVNVADVRRCARARAHPMVFGYLDSGADDEIALRRSNEAFAALELHYHVSSRVRALGACAAASDSAHEQARAAITIAATALDPRGLRCSPATAPRGASRLIPADGASTCRPHSSGGRSSCPSSQRRPPAAGCSTVKGRLRSRVWRESLA
jgi:hypothetical protein